MHLAWKALKYISAVGASFCLFLYWWHFHSVAEQREEDDTLRVMRKIHILMERVNLYDIGFTNAESGEVIEFLESLPAPQDAMATVPMHAELGWVDHWGNSFRFTVRSKERNNDEYHHIEFLVWSLGRNGINEVRKGDDLTRRFTVLKRRLSNTGSTSPTP